MKFLTNAIFLLLPTLIYCESCLHTKVLFKIKDDFVKRFNYSCEDFNGRTWHPAAAGGTRAERTIAELHFMRIHPTMCEIEVCGDGQKHFEKTYCGKGDCDFFGCNCDRGCIEGDPAKNFLAYQDNHHEVELLGEEFGFGTWKQIMKIICG